MHSLQTTGLKKKKKTIITGFFFQSFTIKDTYMFKVSMLV